MVSGADWLSVLKIESTMRLSLLMSFLRTFSTRCNDFETAHSNPMMRFLRAVSTTSLVTTIS